jgi:hypothetical protein
MSDTGMKDKAMPTSVKNNENYTPQGKFFGGICGGMGGGGCLTVLSVVQSIFVFNVPKFVVFNRSLLLDVNFDVYLDGGPDPINGDPCRVPGAAITWYLAFGYDENLTPAQIMAQGNVFTSDDFLIEVQSLKIPQPTNAAWKNKIYVYAYWGIPGCVGSDTITLVKHNYDIKI